MGKPSRGEKCWNRGERRFTVLRVGHPYEPKQYAGRSFQQALKKAAPRYGAPVDVFAACAFTEGEAEFNIGISPRYGKLLRSFRYKRGKGASTPPPRRAR